MCESMNNRIVLEIDVLSTSGENHQSENRANLDILFSIKESLIRRMRDLKYTDNDVLSYRTYLTLQIKNTEEAIDKLSAYIVDELSKEGN